MIGKYGELASIEVNGKIGTNSQILQMDYGHKNNQGHINDKEEQTAETNITESFNMDSSSIDLFEDKDILSSTLDKCDNWNNARTGAEKLPKNRGRN